MFRIKIKKKTKKKIKYIAGGLFLFLGLFLILFGDTMTSQFLTPTTFIPAVLKQLVSYDYNSGEGSSHFIYQNPTDAWPPSWTDGWGGTEIASYTNVQSDNSQYLIIAGGANTEPSFRFNFTLTETPSDITSIFVRINGYSSYDGGEDATCYVADFVTGGGTWTEICQLSTSDDNCDYNITSSASNYIENDQLVYLCVGKNLDSIDRIYIDYINVSVASTLAGDTTPPSLNFTYPTLANATITSNRSVEFNLSITEANLSEFIWNWNGTNISIYDDDLILYYNFDNVTALGEHDNLTLDLSTYNHSSILYGNATINTTDPYHGNSAMQFATRGYVEVEWDDKFDNLTEFVISAWVKADTDVGFGQHGLIGRGLSSNLGYHLFYERPSDGFKCKVTNMSDASYTAESEYGTGIDEKQWNFVACVYNTTDIITYVNGYKDINPAEISGPIQGRNNYFHIGDQNSSAVPAQWKGLIDEVRMYNKSFSDQEVYQLYISNLNKFNTTDWYFYINQSKNATDVLEYQNYSYFASAKDWLGNENMTQIRDVEIQEVGESKIDLSIITPEDLTIFTNATQNSSYFNVSINVTCRVKDCNEINVSLDIIGNYTVQFYTGAGDGNLQNFTTAGKTWGDAHNAISGEANSGGVNILAGSQENSGGVDQFTIWRGFIPTNTSTLPDTSIVISASFYGNISVLNNGDDDGNDNISIVLTNQSDPTTIVALDYDNIGIIRGSQEVDLSNIAAGNQTVFTLNAIGRSWINLTGFTMLGIREGHDLLDSAIANDAINRIGLATSETAGTHSDPYMNVTYELLLISNTTADTPFYTNSSRTINVSLTKDESQIITFWINATGAINSNHTFFAYANQSTDVSINNISDTWNVSIEVTTTAASSCTCTDDSNWEIDMSDYCNLTSTCHPLAVTFINTGWFNCSAQLNCTSFGNLANNQRVWATSSCQIIEN